MKPPLLNLILLSCGAATIAPVMAQSGPRQLTPAERQACSRQGGIARRQGSLGNEMCVVRFADAGKACTGKRDCAGDCLYPPGEYPAPRIGTKASGQCEFTNSPFGCRTSVEGGRIAGAICVD